MKEVDTHFRTLASWKKELKELRKIVLACGLKEEWKWSQPCYTANGGNVLMVCGFKGYCCISFFKGALLKDPKGILTTPGSHSRATKQIRFTSVDEIIKLKATLATYIKTAIKIEKSGKKIDYKKDADVTPSQEFIDLCTQDKKFKTAFEKLTPGRQRAYLLFFNAAKQSATRLTRIKKFKPRILKGFGMNDCVCGLSKRMPQCDGSHRELKK